MKASLLLGHNGNSTLHFSPRIFSYSLPQQYNLCPSTSLYKNNNGAIFIGKKNGILGMYHDKFYFLPNNHPVYITGDQNGNVFYAVKNDFGLLYFDEFQGLVTNSLKDKVPSQHQSFDPYNIVTLNEIAFIATSEGVIVYKNTTLDFVFFQRKKCRLYKTNHQIFVVVEGEGLYKWNKTDFQFLVNHNDFERNLPTSISYKGQSYFIFSEKGCLKYDSAEKSIEEISSKRQIYHLINLEENISLTSNNNHELYLQTLSSNAKLVIHDAFKAPIVSIFKDSFNDIWILYDFNLQKIEFPSFISTLKLNNTLDGTVLSSFIDEEMILLGTSDGLISLETQDNIFWQTKTLHKQKGEFFHFIKKFKQTTISASNKGLYDESFPPSRLIEKGNFSFLLVPQEDQIIAVSQEGLCQYSKNGENWERKILIDSISNILSGTIFKQNLVFIDHYHQIWKYDFKEEKIEHLNLATEQKINDISKSGSSLYLLYDNDIWKTTDLQEFSHINKRIKFSNIHLFDLYSKLNTLINISRTDNDSDYYNILDKTTNTSSINVPGQYLDQLISIDFTSSDIWLTRNNSIIRIKRSERQRHIPNQYTVNAYLYNEETKFSKEKVQDNASFTHKKNNLDIKIFNNRYQYDPGALYRYKLTHYQEIWSEWSQEDHFNVPNLWERDYHLLIEALSPSGQISDTYELYFTIEPPFYRSIYAYIIYALLFLFTIFLIYKWQLLRLKKVESRVEMRIKERTDAILKEKEKSDKLVADMFPKTTAEELKTKGRAKSEKFKKATVLFSDIQGFTRIAEEMNPDVLIDELDKFFFHFDSVVEKYNIEKIKTIGDAYMAAGGIPIKNSSNPVEVVLAGLEMQHYMKELKKQKADIWDLRIGVHTGPVIAGVVGHKKLSYDIWGDTVNTASRMESSGEIGKVNISGNTYAMVKDYFICEYRGKLPVKYKGNIDMYFVKGLRPELSIDLQGIPNKRFYIKLQLLRLQDIEARLFEHILQDIHLALHFHTKDFILRVYNQTELLARSENNSEEDKLLLQTAALLLYSGLSETYENFETKSASIAREILPDYSYSERQIDVVCNLILSAKEPFYPQNRMEAILIDAKMEYLGRADFITQIKLLFLEQKNSKRESSKDKIINKHIELLSNFNYFTLAGQRLREIDAVQQIEILQKWK